jgi:hypothetical protein
MISGASQADIGVLVTIGPWALLLSFSLVIFLTDFFLFRSYLLEKVNLKLVMKVEGKHANMYCLQKL